MSEWSVPETEVMDSIEELLAADRSAMLATVVDVEGSAYRRPGAKMIVDPEAGGIGSITAGCLEDEIRQLAERVVADGEVRLETFDLMGDDDVWGLGVGCNGVIDVLLEPLTESFRPAVAAVQAGRDARVATVLESSDDRLALGDRAHGPAFDAFPEPVATALSERGGSDSGPIAVETDRGSVTVFLDAIEAPADLVVIGSGHDVGPVAELGTLADFRVTVVGYRGGTATDDRFPEADRVVSTSPRSITDEIEFDAETYAVVMTHNFIDDRVTLEALLETPLEYIGLMGPEDRFDELLEAIEGDGRQLTPAELDRIYTPVGLDLGGGAPYQVAQSIVAEALAVRYGRTGGHLRSGDGTIHPRPASIETDP